MEDLLEDKRTITEGYLSATNLNNLELYRIIGENFEEVKPIYPLIEFILARLETANFLTLSERVWDAEIILRSAIETLVKLLFISSVDGTERETRLREFWHDLAEINELKQSDQARLNLSLRTDEISKLAYSPIRLPESDEKYLREKWSRVERKKLEQKWSFSEVVQSLSTNFKGQQLEMFLMLKHSYRIGSHISHGDETGILIIRERNSRNPDEKDVANFAHYLRLVADCFYYSVLTATATMDLLRLEKKTFINLVDSLDEIRRISAEHEAKIYDDEMYDKFRT